MPHSDSGPPAASREVPSHVPLGNFLEGPYTYSSFRTTGVMKVFYAGESRSPERTGDVAQVT